MFGVSALVGNLWEFVPTLTAFSRFIIAILMVGVGFIVGRYVGKFVEKVVRSLGLNGFGKDKGRRRIDRVAGTTVKYFIYVIAVILALNQIGLALNFLNNVLMILLVVVAIGLFLSIKDFVPNAVAGAYVTYKGRIKVGQRIKVKDVEGTVKNIDLVESCIKTKNGHVIIPNSFFVRNVVEVKRK